MESKEVNSYEPYIVDSAEELKLKYFVFSLKMCGRTCCTLSPDLLPYACSTVTKHNGVSHFLLFVVT